MRALSLVLVLIAGGGCAGLQAQAKAAGESEAQLIMADIAKDAVAAAPCALQLLPTVAAVYAGDIAALVSEGACIANAVQLILSQVKGGAIAPDKPTLLKVQTAKTLYKAAAAPVK